MIEQVDVARDLSSGQSQEQLNSVWIGVLFAY